MLCFRQQTHNIVRDHISEEMTLTLKMTFMLKPKVKLPVTNGGKASIGKDCSGKGLHESKNWRESSIAGV